MGGGKRGCGKWDSHGKWEKCRKLCKIAQYFAIEPTKMGLKGTGRY